MTYGEMYDEMLDECSESCATCRSYGASRILKEVDPTAYRCGFVDWLDGLELDKCPECGLDMHDDYKQDADMEDEVKCSVCSGDAFVCEECNDVFPVDDRFEDKDARDVCESCCTELAEPEEEEDE